jgi:hypothetical protein
MVRSVQRGAADVLDRLGLLRDGGQGSQRVTSEMIPAFRAPRVETEAEQRAAERARQAHNERNPRNAQCVNCMCMRWESTRAANNDLIWICSGCKRRFGSAREVPAPLPAPPPQLTPTEARESLTRSVAAVATAVSDHDSVGRSATGARSASAAAEQAVETAEEALAAAQADAVTQARRALEAGQAVPSAGLGKVRAALEQAQDALAAARGAHMALEAQQAEARKALASARAKAETAATVTVAAELAPALIERMTAQAAQIVRDYSTLDWLVKHYVGPSDPAVPGLLALVDMLPRNWPQMAKTVPEVSAALDRTVVALVNDPTTEVPSL